MWLGEIKDHVKWKRKRGRVAGVGEGKEKGREDGTRKGWKEE